MLETLKCSINDVFTLYHYPICPFSRIVRILLIERNIDFKSNIERFWERRKEFLKMNPFGTTPLLITPESNILKGKYAIINYLEEVYNAEHAKRSALDRASINSISEWCNEKLYNEVTNYLLSEKLVKMVSSDQSAPLSNAIRAAKNNLRYHMDYFTYILGNNKYFVSDTFSIADIILASHFSVIDYLGDMIWEKFQKLKIWYSLMKSRPSFKLILADKIKFINPPHYYNNPDF